MSEWTPKQVAERFEEAAFTADRLPPVHVQGYFNTWPAIMRQRWEQFASESRRRRYPPSPASIDRMIETVRWITWLEEAQRHLIWMRAQRLGWRDICAQYGCNRSTAWRRWQHALTIVAVRLNAELAAQASKAKGQGG